MMRVRVLITSSVCRLDGETPLSSFCFLSGKGGGGLSLLSALAAKGLGLGVKEGAFGSSGFLPGLGLTASFVAPKVGATLQLDQC